MTNQAQNPNAKKKYDLEERTAKFGESVIAFVRDLSDTSINHTLVSQVVRSASSIGVNYTEADAAISKKDFFSQNRPLQERSKGNVTLVQDACQSEPGL